jgi:hypothetical protein
MRITTVLLTVALSAVSARAAEKPVSATGIDIIQNGGFEVGLMNWGWSSRGTDGYAGDAKMVAIDPQPTREKATDAPEGRYVMQMKAPAHARWTIQHRQYVLKKGSYKVTGWFYVDQAVTFSAGGASTQVSPAAKWQQVALDVTIPQNDTRFSLSVAGVGPGVARMDDFHIMALDPAAATRLPVQVGLEVSAADKVFMAGQAKTMTIRAFSNEAVSGKLAYRIENAWGEMVLSDTFDANLPAAQVLEHPLSLALPKTGHYRVLAQFQQGAKLLSGRAELLFGIVPDRVLPTSIATGEDSHFGVNMVQRPRLIELARKMGVRWVYCAPPLFTKWMCAEPRKGEWLFYDDLVKMFHDAGIHICGNLADPPSWATDPKASAQYGGPWPNNELPMNWTDWEKYVQTVVSHYYPRIRHWALWNEPDHSAFLKVAKDDDWPAVYLNLLKHTYPIAKAVKPDVAILAGATTNPGSLRSLVPIGGLQYADGMAFHWASWSPDGYRRYTGEEIGVVECGKNPSGTIPDLIAAMKQAGKIVPLWDTECHLTQAYIQREYITQPDVIRPGIPSMTRVDAANAVVRQYLAEWAAGVQKSFAWLFETCSTDERNDVTLLEWDSSPCAGVVAYAVMTHMLEGAALVECGQQTSEVWLDKPVLWTFHFRTPRGRVRVVWSNTDEKHEWMLPVKGTKATVYDMFGVECPGTKIKSGVTLEKEIVLNVARSPYYIIDEP